MNHNKRERERKREKENGSQVVKCHRSVRKKGTAICLDMYWRIQSIIGSLVKN